MKAVVIGAAAALIGGTVLAADPEDMKALADRNAKAAANALSRHSLGRTQIADYPSAKFRNVRAHYRRSDMFTDLVIFCGEADIKGPDGKPTGWIKFGYWPGDPTTFFTDRADVGMPQIGPQVYKAHCASGKEQWLEGDYTADFMRRPDTVAANG